MQKYLSFLILVLAINMPFSVLNAQDDKSNSLKKGFWSNKESHLTVADIPSHWGKESAIILYQEFKYIYDKVRGKMLSVESFHRRILLQDKSAVNEFSEFSFAESFKGKMGYSRTKGKTLVGFKIIKPDGTEQEIDLANAVEIESENGKDQLKKIAIPGLQVGDVIDYYYHVEEKFPISPSHIFTPVISTLNSTYPIKRQRLEFSVEKNFYINFRSMNGASDLTVKDEGKRKRFYLVEEDIERYENALWMYKYRSLPAIKFQVVYNRLNPTQVFAFLGKEGDPKTEVSKEQLKAFFLPKFEGYDADAVANYKAVNKYLKDNGYDEKPPKEMLEAAYHFLSHYMVGQHMDRYTIGEGRDPWVNQYGFVSTFHYFLEKKKIPHDLIITVPRDLSNIDNMVLFSEVSVLLRVILDEEIFVSNFDLHPHFNEIPPDYENANSYALNLLGRGNIIQKIKLPASTMKDNHTEIVVNVAFKDKDFTTLTFDNRYNYQGRNRIWYQNRILNVFDYLDEDHKRYGTKSFLAKTKLNVKEKEVLNEKIVAVKKQDEERREEALKYIIEDDYGAQITRLKEFKIHTFGRSIADPYFDYSTNFELKGLVKKAGPNYILEVGKLIGSQIEIKDDAMKRSADIYMPYARSFDYTIKIQIPEGYKVQGVDALNIKVENETGGFVSSGTVEGEQLVIKTKKYYNQNYEPVANWPLMLEFLEAAYTFTQEKVLLKNK